MFLLQVFSTVNEFFEQSAYKDQQLVKKSVESVTPRERVLGTRDAYYPVLGTRPLSMPTILLGTRDVEETRADGTRVSKQVTDVCFDLPLEKVLKRLFALCPDFLRDCRQPFPERLGDGEEQEQWSDLQASLSRPARRIAAPRHRRHHRHHHQHHHTSTSTTRPSAATGRLGVHGR